MANYHVHYHASNPLNRASWVRQNAEFLNKAAASNEARYLILDNLSPLCQSGSAEDKSFTLVTVSYDLVKSYLPSPIFSMPDDYKAPISFEEEDKKPGLVFLGFEEDPAHASLPEKQHLPEGSAFIALDATNLPELKEAAIKTVEGRHVAFVDLRTGVSRLSMNEAGIVSEARSLIDWNKRNRFCPSCGNATVSVWAGWKKACIADESRPACITKKGVHNVQYPRTDPVCIMAILHPTEDKILLGRNKSWPKGFMSCLAGFLEPGEGIEEAVKREVWEEAGVRCKEVYYHSSQPWPYPSSIMIGALAVAEENQTIRLDLDNELDQALWVSREFVLQALDKRSNISRIEMQQMESGNPNQSGLVEDMKDVRLPPDSAIAHVLIDSWARGTWKRPSPAK